MNVRYLLILLWDIFVTYSSFILRWKSKCSKYLMVDLILKQAINNVKQRIQMSFLFMVRYFIFLLNSVFLVQSTG